MTTPGATSTTESGRTGAAGALDGGEDAVRRVAVVEPRRDEQGAVTAGAGGVDRGAGGVVQLDRHHHAGQDDEVGDEEDGNGTGHVRSTAGVLAAVPVFVLSGIWYQPCSCSRRRRCSSCTSGASSAEGPSVTTYGATWPTGSGSTGAVGTPISSSHWAVCADELA